MTKSEFNLRNFTTILLILIIIMLLSIFVSKSKQNKVNENNISSLQSEVKTYFLKNGNLVLSVENLQYTNEQLKKNVLSKDLKLKELTEKFSKVHTATKYVTNTIIDTVKIAYKDTVPYTFERTGSIAEKEYSFSYKSNQKGLQLDNFKITDSVMIVSGEKTTRKWFLGKRTKTTNFDITHSNKYIQTTQAQNIQIIEKKKWYETDILKIGIGFIGGALLMK